MYKWCATVNNIHIISNLLFLYNLPSCWERFDEFSKNVPIINILLRTLNNYEEYKFEHKPIFIVSIGNDCVKCWSEHLDFITIIIRASKCF